MTGLFFNMKHFEDQVQAGEWDEVEHYLYGFTKVEDNRYSLKIFFEIRKRKYLEALDKQDRAKAVEILVKDLKVFASYNQEVFKEITQLLTLDNFRQNEQLSKYGSTKSAPNRARPPSINSPFVGPIPKAGAFPPIGAQVPFQTVVSPFPGVVAGWMSNNSPSLPHPAMAVGPPPSPLPQSSALF
ncbi:hypothetical protein Pint_21694 [Pistacia integerrima]|uniref:Uncharacterized protein n=1 Tax=Pistacia integerrima TaxID=434235 RepID=A0ACC0XCQ8_9ROSI|nr:hypothetical protein Pint_21694 [Pistacia integerrima]